MQYLLEITVDPNDADYITSTYVLKENQTGILDLMRKVARVIKTGERHNWEMGHRSRTPLHIVYDSQLTEEEIEIFNTYLPYGEGYIHTIVSITIYEINNIEKL